MTDQPDLEPQQLEWHDGDYAPRIGTHKLRDLSTTLAIAEDGTRWRPLLQGGWVQITDNPARLLPSTHYTGDGCQPPHAEVYGHPAP